MEVRTLQAILGCLNAADVRYLVVGGMAVVAHGHGRMTHDLDLVIDLEATNVLAAFAALASIGYRPLVPIRAADFADAAERERWIREKGMTVLNLSSDQHRTTPVDLFVESPFDFAPTFARAVVEELDGEPFRYVDLETLIEMKRRAGRPIDLDDIEQLRRIADEH